jgi:putative PIN family toxin of toxin-antitoxin system
MTARQRVVIDTNAMVSRLLLPESVPGKAVRKAVDQAELLVSEATLNELADVLAREKFNPYISIEERQEFLRLLGRIAEMVPIILAVYGCRDPQDDKFLEIAVNGEANMIVTGDKDLLVLNPFRGIAIVTPSAYPEMVEEVH